MSEEIATYEVKGRKIYNNEVYLAAQRLADFCKQFDRMTEEEKLQCLKRAEEKSFGLLPELYNKLDDYYG